MQTESAGTLCTEGECAITVVTADQIRIAEGHELARMMFVNYGSVPVYTEFFRWLGWGERLDPMVEAYRAGDRTRALALAPDELISEIYVTGSVTQIRERLAEFVARGVTTVVLAPMCAPEQLPELLAALAPR